MDKPKKIVSKFSKQVQLVLELLDDERMGNVAAALKKMDKKYSMTWVYQGKQKLFPRSKPDFKIDMQEVYKIKGRKYDIKNIAEGKNLVMIELVESYPDPATKKVYRTPLVLVLEMKNGKVAKGRHYCDPAISYMFLSKEEVSKAF